MIASQLCMEWTLAQKMSHSLLVTAAIRATTAIYDVYLMEDRATCRIASQYLANWFHHGLISRQEILDAFEKMALKVDKQNEGAMGYNKLSTNPRTPAFLAALELVFEGQNQSCGYIEETMFKYRRQILSGIVES